MRAATLVLTVITACVVAAVLSVSIFSVGNAAEPAAHTIAPHHEALSTNFSAEASQLVVERA